MYSEPFNPSQPNVFSLLAEGLPEQRLGTKQCSKSATNTADGPHSVPNGVFSLHLAELYKTQVICILTVDNSVSW